MARLSIASAIVVALVFVAGSAWGQPSFDAASVKLAGPRVSGPPLTPPQGGPGTADPGRITFGRTVLGVLLMAAYGVSGDQISGPAWLFDSSDPHIYAFTATMPPDTTKDQYQFMLRNLLAERFHITVHHETKDFPGYDLVLSGTAIKLKQWEPNAPDPAPAAGGRGQEADGFPILPPGVKALARINVAMAAGGGPATASSTRASYRETMDEFAAGLGPPVRTANGGNANSPAPHVTNKTGLTGIYQFHLQYEMANMSAAGAAGADDLSLSGPTFFSALEQQLGLKLRKASSVPVDIIVIDHIDQTPAEN